MLLVSKALLLTQPFSPLPQQLDNGSLLLLNRIDRELNSTGEWLAMFETVVATANTMRLMWRVCPAARLFRQQKGSAAVEFGLVVAPFLALLFAIIETSIVFFAGQALETAVADSSRLIMTGQAQSQNFDASAFKNAVCAKIFGLFDCQNGVYVDVRTFTSFSNVSMPSPVDGQGNFQNNFQYQPGGPGDIVVVRLFYQYPVYVSLLGFNLSNVNGGKRLLAATAAFRNEPYSN